MEPTYSPGEVELVPVLERHSVAAAEPSVDTIAQVEQDDIGLSSIGVTPSPEDTRPPARVKWPQDLGRHVSVKMASPQTLVDEGAQALLSDALAQHQMANAPLESRYFGPSAPSSETTSTRASSEDGNPDERMQLLREDMEIFVDPGETFGLPSISTKPADDVNKKAAWDLVRSYTSGRQGFMRRRKRGISKKEEAKDELNEKQGDEEEGGSPGYFESKVRRSENLGGDPASMGFSATNAGGTGGVLSSLMALQQTGLQSGTSTPGTSIVSSRASSVNGGYSSASDDEEEEREKFTLAQREKKRKNLWNVPATTVSGVGKVGKAVVGAAYSLATNKPATKKPAVVVTDAPVRPSPLNSFIASRTTMPMASPEITSADMSHSRTSSGQNSPGLYHPRRPKSVFGESVQQLKKLGEKVGLDLARPEAARSSAGVFGGLIASTGNIAGVAAPSATRLGPSTSRPGYNLSRYSAPILPTLNRPASPSLSATGRPSDEELSRPVTRPSSPSPLPSPPVTLSSPRTPSVLPRPGKPGFSLHLKDLHLKDLLRPVSIHGGGATPDADVAGGDYFMGHKETTEERESREWEKEKRRRKHKKEKRKQEEVFIVAHVAAILSRQDFIMKLGRAFMMFGAPSHRLEAQMQATARVLEINCQVIYIPGVMLISFGDAATHTSEIKFLKQANGLDLGKLLAAYYVYWNVIHDRISVTEASIELDGLMIAPPKYKLWQHLIIGGLASAFIQPSAFYGSLIDCLASIPLGALLVLVQVVVSKNDLYSSLFEIVIACVNAFLAAALASTGQFCFSAVASGSVVLILPGYIVLCGSLELANRSIISGSVRLVYSVLYSLFLGFGLSMGSEVYQRITGLAIRGSTDYTCSALRLDAPWYRATISPWFFFLSAPGYLLLLGLRNGQPFYRRETIIMIVVGCSGWVCNYFSARLFPNRPDISSAIGSFVVGFLGNVYGKFTRGSPFVVMVVGVLFQLPSGLANGGLLQFASAQSSSTVSYSAGFSTAESLVQVAIGLTVGLFVSAAIVNFFGGGRRRGSNLSSF